MYITEGGMPSLSLLIENKRGKKKKKNIQLTIQSFLAEIITIIIAVFSVYTIKILHI